MDYLEVSLTASDVSFLLHLIFHGPESIEKMDRQDQIDSLVDDGFLVQVYKNGTLDLIGVTHKGYQAAKAFVNQTEPYFICLSGCIVLKEGW